MSHKGCWGACGVNSLAPDRHGSNFKCWILLHILMVDVLGEIVIRWMPQDLTDVNSKLVQVVAWCHQAPSHYLSQCWLSSMSTYGVTRGQWVITLRPGQKWCHFAKNIFKHIFLKRRSWISLRISFKFVSKCPTEATLLIQVMAWCRIGNMSLPEPVLTKFHTTIWPYKA